MDYETLFDKAAQQYMEGETESALSNFLLANNLLQTDDCLNYIGNCYIELGDYKKAIKIFNRLVKDCPGWEAPILNLGLTYYMLKDYKKALVMYDQAMELNPNSGEAYFNRGRLYEVLGYFELAEKDYKKSLELDPNPPETHLNLGNIYLVKRLPYKALDEFILALKLRQNLFEANMGKGAAFLQLEQYDDALTEFKCAYVNSFKRNETATRISYTYFLMHEYELADEWIQKSLEIDPDFVMAQKLHDKIEKLK